MYQNEVEAKIYNFDALNSGDEIVVTDGVLDNKGPLSRHGVFDAKKGSARQLHAWGMNCLIRTDEGHQASAFFLGYHSHA